MLPSLLLSTYSTLASLFPSLSSPPALAPTKGAVASEVQLCSDIGRDFLAKGGSAADAMVGMCACVGVIASYHSGFGGGKLSVAQQLERAEGKPDSGEPLS
jgi:gamma-glutamyltranspeptidase